MSEPDVDVAAAERLEREAQDLVDGGRRSKLLTMALDQLRADRGNGESLTSAVARLRAAVDDARDSTPGGRPG